MGLMVRLLLQQLTGSMQCDERAVLFVIERLDGALGGVEQGLRIGEAAMLRIEFFPFVALRRELLKLTDLPRQAVALTLQ